VLLLAAGLAGAAGPASARPVEWGPVSGNLDTTLSIGTTLRVQDRDCRLLYTGHGGCNDNPFFINADDGNLNYEQGDFTSVAAKLTMELELRYANYGGFFRGTAFYDFLQNEPHHTDRTDLDRDARYRTSVINSGVVGMGVLLLDAYLWGNWVVAERPLELRAGNMVVSWGESLFTPGGINQTNAIDVSRLRTPGSELREALLPAPMVWGSVELARGLGLEAYYQFYWNRLEVDPTGSYFATSDLVGRAAQGLFLPVVTGFGPGGPILDPTQPADPGATGLSPEQLFAANRGVPRTRDEKPRNLGQGGVALRWFAEPIRTEFGLYYIRYHGKTPSVGVKASTNLLTGFLDSYYREYPEGIDLYGASFSTEIFNAAIAGEISYRPDDPVPIAAPALPSTIFFSTGMLPPTGKYSGFVNEQRWQGSVNALMTLGPGTRWIGPLVSLLGADDVSVAAEVTFVDYPDLDSDTLYAPPGGRDLGDVDEFSWGYQLLVQPTYTNPFDVPITVTPRLGYQHDVNGNTPGQLPFIDGRMAVSVGVNVDYLNTWAWDLSYTNFLEGNTGNLLKDRDFVAMSLSYSF
jgi:hypothetical protein